MSTPGTTYSTDPALYVFTSLTAGSSHIVTATSRLETILRANKVPFKAVDIAVDEKARMLWGRRAGKDADGRVRKLPGLVQEGLVLGDLVEIEDWNEYGELKQNIKIYYDDHTIPPISQKPVTPPPKPSAVMPPKPAAAPAPPAPPPLPAAGKAKEENTKSESSSSSAAAAASKVTMPIRSIADEAAQKAKDLRLQSLREKVHGKKDDSSKQAEEEKEEEKQEEEKETKNSELDSSEKEPATTATTTTATTTTATRDSFSSSDSKPGPQHPGLQSPTTATWKVPSSPDKLREMLQSPTSTSWQPTHVDPPVTSLHGSFVENASEEEIAAIERAETIQEEEEEDDDDDDSEEEDSEEEGQQATTGGKSPAAAGKKSA